MRNAFVIDDEIYIATDIYLKVNIAISMVIIINNLWLLIFGVFSPCYL